MAFGESLGTVVDRTRQVQVMKAGEVITGPLGQAVFKTQDPAVAESILHIFDVSRA